MREKIIYQCNIECRTCTHNGRDPSGWSAADECMTDECPKNHLKIGNIDTVGGRHLDGYGWNPLGEFCSRCENENCEECSSWKNRNKKLRFLLPPELKEERIKSTIQTESKPKENNNTVLNIELHHTNTHDAFDDFDLDLFDTHKDRNKKENTQNNVEKESIPNDKNIIENDTEIIYEDTSSEEIKESTRKTTFQDRKNIPDTFSDEYIDKLMSTDMPKEKEEDITKIITSITSTKENNNDSIDDDDDIDFGETENTNENSPEFDIENDEYVDNIPENYEYDDISDEFNNAASTMLMDIDEENSEFIESTGYLDNEEMYENQKEEQLITEQPAIVIPQFDDDDEDFDEEEDSDFTLNFPSNKIKHSLIFPNDTIIAKYQIGNKGISLKVVGTAKITVKGKDANDGFSYRDASKYPRYMRERLADETLFTDDNFLIEDNSCFAFAFFEIRNGETIETEVKNYVKKFDFMSETRLKKILHNQLKERLG